MDRPFGSFRKHFLLGGIISLILLCMAYLLEYVEHLNPCPLCLLQRYTFWLITFVFFLGALLKLRPLGQQLFTSVLIVLAFLGMGLSGRQVWLQQLPPEHMPSCTAGLDRLLSYHSIPDTLKIILSSSGECGIVDYRLMGLSLALWSLMVFIGLAVYGSLIALQIKKRRN